MNALAPITLVCLAISVPVFSQEPQGEAPRTREEAIATERADKVAELWPERQSPLVNRVNALVERGFGEGLESGRGVNGPQLVLGGTRSGQGMSVGLGYRRSDLWRERLGLRGTARGTVQGAYLFDFNLDFQGLETERTQFRWYSKFESSPQIDFYGLGNASSADRHTGYGYDDLTSDFDAAYEAFRNVRLGVTGGYLHAHTERGSDAFLPFDQIFEFDRTPGLGRDTHFSRFGAFAAMDYRDSRSGPRSGGLYGLRYREYWDIDLKEFAFRQWEMEVQQYVPYYNKGRVLALRAAVVLSFPKGDDQLPVYLQPTLGGNDNLRGFGNYRFRDSHSLYLSGEHRWHLSSNLEMAAFVDAGKVVPSSRNVDLTQLHYSGGVGFRVRVRSAVVTRIDFAGSSEGFRMMWTFSDIYAKRF
jgi:outer membrane protein assembly factor BamA